MRQLLVLKINFKILNLERFISIVENCVKINMKKVRIFKNKSTKVWYSKTNKEGKIENFSIL